jgi:hypothetical protein
MARDAGTNFPEKMRSHMDTNCIAPSPSARRGEVTTFYAYDGGPARSLALAHAAWQLSGRDGAGAPVLMIDWDLACPGLHGVFPGLAHASADAGQERAGVLELFETCRERLRTCARPGADDAEALAARVLDGFDWDAHIERVDDTRPLYLMRAGCLDGSYGERVDSFDWDALFRACPALFRGFAAHLTSHFAHVLIDCGSGRSAATSVCTALLPDKMVGLFTPELRSLDGLCGVVARALDYRCSHEDDQRPLLVYPLPSPIEAAGEARLHWRCGNPRHADARHGDARCTDPHPEGYQAVLENLLGDCYGIAAISLDSYLDEVQLPLSAVLGSPLPCGAGGIGANDRLGPARCIAALLEWAGPGHFPWRPLAEVRLMEAVEALRARAADPEAPGEVRELARLAQSYLGQQGELDAARRIEQHVVALEQGMHAMEEGQRPGPTGALRRAADAGAPGADAPGADAPGAAALGDKLSRLQELIDSRSPHEARALADSLRSTVLRPSVAHPLRRRGAAMIKQVYLQGGDKDALLAFTQDEVSTLEGALIEAGGG